MPSPSNYRRKLILAGCVVPLLPACAAIRPARAYEEVHVAAPFAMPPIRIPDFAGAPRFPITDFGADQRDQARTSAAIARAIDAAHAAGGGIVVVPAGVWPTAKIHLKSHVNLHVAAGATLLFSAQPTDYLPAVHTTWEGLECYNYSPLVYAYECENVALTGTGTLRAQLDVWRVWYARPKAHMDALVRLYDMSAKGTPLPVQQRDMTVGDANLRPQFVQFNRCRHVLVEDVTIEDSPFWVLHPYLSRDVVIRRVKITAHGHNNDGVDPEMSQNVLIEDCVFDQGDDAISVKSGRDRDAWRLDTPSRNIVMRNCRIKNGHQLCAIGSELSGGIENVFVDNCHFDHTGSNVPSTINNILYVKTNERRGGYVRNIHLSNVTATSVKGGVLAVETDVLYQWKTLLPTYERRLTAIEGLHVSNVTVQDAGFVCLIKGEAEQPVRDVSLRGVRVARIGGTAVTNVNVQGFVQT
ncbi:glycosyl hydrolase family 28 [Pseudoduganella flava]|uniref:Glycosyl hydrolase family 28 n=1 Tax=Pseudoduganella flava TaxID=871742 RepID=A0A562PZK1_9BURK|nr:glycoside hydrolase family 28 protein [Pseudoduganella flava]TWI49813.1 glycosyl hydrolase family 28 [Pseudoduganella flava]